MSRYFGNSTCWFRIALPNDEWHVRYGHTSGSIALFEPERGWLLTGDSVMDHGVYYVTVGNPPRGLEPMMVYYDTLRRLRERKADFSALFPGHGRSGISPDAFDDAVENLRQIHEREGDESPVDMTFGLTGTRHQVGTSLIYYSDEYAEPFRARELVR